MEQYKEVELYSQAWYEKRLGRFTSSEMHKLIGGPRCKEGELSEAGNTYVLEKVAERMTRQTKDEARGNAIEWGHAHEIEALQAACDALKIDIAPCEFVEFGEYAGGTPDGLGSDLSVIEAKCPYNSANHIANLLIKDQADLKKNKPEYYWQIVANCHFTQTRKGYLVSFDPRQIPTCRTKVIEVVPTQEDIDLMAAKLSLAIQTMKAHYLTLTA
jgi:hypothetical protein